MAYYARSRYLGRPPVLASLLQDSQTTASLLRRQQRSSVCDSEQNAAAIQFTPSEHQQTGPLGRDREQAVVHLGLGEGGLFAGIDQAAAHSVAATNNTHATQQVPWETESARDALAAVPSTQQLEEERARRKDLLPLDSKANRILHYRVHNRLGQGGLSTVFLAQDERTGKKVALKLSTKPLATLRDDQHPKDIKAPEFVRELYRTSWDYRCFCSENEAFGKLNCTDARISEHGLPRLYDSGLVVISGIRVHSFLVMSLLGDSVYDQIQVGSTRDRTYLCQLAHGMLDSLRYIHGCGLVHRDVKPGNFCLPHATTEDAASTFIIDFGFVRPIPKATDRQHQDFEGTPDYASINALNSRCQGPCDDLECLVYSIVEMWNGDLLWDVPNVQLWSREDYEVSVRRLYTPDEAERLLALRPEQRPALPWDEPNLALMARMRRKEWAAAVSQGQVPRFLQLWLKIVQKLKPWDVPPAALYEQLHDLIDSGLECDAAMEQEEEDAGQTQPVIDDGRWCAGAKRPYCDAVPDSQNTAGEHACKRFKPSELLSQREA